MSIYLVFWYESFLHGDVSVCDLLLCVCPLVPVFMCNPCGIRFSSLSTLEAHQTYYCSHRTGSAAIAGGTKPASHKGEECSTCRSYVGVIWGVTPYTGPALTLMPLRETFCPPLPIKSSASFSKRGHNITQFPDTDKKSLRRCNFWSKSQRSSSGDTKYGVIQLQESECCCRLGIADLHNNASTCSLQLYLHCCISFIDGLVRIWT